MIGKTALPVKAWKAEYAKLTAEQETLNRRQLAAGTAGAAAPQGAGYGAVTDRAAVLKSVVSKPPFGVRFRLGRVNRTAAHPTVFLYAVSVGGCGIIFENTLSVCFQNGIKFLSSSHHSVKVIRSIIHWFLYFQNNTIKFVCHQYFKAVLLTKYL